MAAEFDPVSIESLFLYEHRLILVPLTWLILNYYTGTKFQIAEYPKDMIVLDCLPSPAGRSRVFLCQTSSKIVRGLRQT